MGFRLLAGSVTARATRPADAGAHRRRPGRPPRPRPRRSSRSTSWSRRCAWPRRTTRPRRSLAGGRLGTRALRAVVALRRTRVSLVGERPGRRPRHRSHGDGRQLRPDGREPDRVGHPGGETDMVLLTGGEAVAHRRRRPEGVDRRAAVDDPARGHAAARAARRATRPDPAPGDGARHLHARADLPDVRDVVCGPLGPPLDEHRQRVAALWSRFSEVAGEQPATPGSERAHTADEIATGHARQPHDRLPVHEAHELNNNVEQSAASDPVLGRGGRATLASRATAGCSRTRAPTPTTTGTCRTGPICTRRRPSARRAGALELAGTDGDELAHVDLYSCFPSAVQIGAAELSSGSRAPAGP